jgi:hypothetical protein
MYGSHQRRPPRFDAFLDYYEHYQLQASHYNRHISMLTNFWVRPPELSSSAAQHGCMACHGVALTFKPSTDDKLTLLSRSTVDIIYLLSLTRTLSSFTVAFGIACEINNSVYKNLVL